MSHINISRTQSSKTHVKFRLSIPERRRKGICVAINNSKSQWILKKFPELSLSCQLKGPYPLWLGDYPLEQLLVTLKWGLRKCLVKETRISDYMWPIEMLIKMISHFGAPKNDHLNHHWKEIIFHTRKSLKAMSTSRVLEKNMNQFQIKSTAF